MTTRGSGLLLHITSLPSRFGIGDVGPAAFAFADLLARAGQRYWQILPLTPTDPGADNDPYHSISAFALNPLLISPELLAAAGLLDPDDLEGADPPGPDDAVDFDRVIHDKDRLFDRAFDRFRAAGDHAAFDRFCGEQAGWLDDFALFAAIRADRHGHAWHRWPEPLRRCEPAALDRERDRLRDRVDRARFLQFVMATQWERLHAYCHDRGIQVIGDLPIYVDHDSVEVWRHPGSFQLDDDLRPTAVSGVPPDAFSATGQVWYHPLYRWDALQRDGFSWWTQRVARALATVDLLRIDHFRGLVAYWAVPAGSTTAVTGQWMPAPGRDLLATLARRFPCLPVIAEDLGLITPDVRELVREFGIPGMRVLLFAFDSSPGENIHLPHHVVRDSVVYTGTHDNNPVRGWLETEATDAQRDRLFAYLGREVAPADLPWTLVRLALSTVAETVIVPVQDLLGLGAGARMNRPGTHAGNWRWRLAPGALTPAVVDRLAATTKTYDRT